MDFVPHIVGKSSEMSIKLDDGRVVSCFQEHCEAFTVQVVDLELQVVVVVPLNSYIYSLADEQRDQEIIERAVEHHATGGHATLF